MDDARRNPLPRTPRVEKPARPYERPSRGDSRAESLPLARPLPRSLTWVATEPQILFARSRSRHDLMERTAMFA